MKSLLSESMFSPYFAYLLKSPCLKMRHQKTFHMLRRKQLLLLILMVENSQQNFLLKQAPMLYTFPNLKIKNRGLKNPIT